MSRTKKTTQTRDIPAWLESGSQQAVGRAQEIADRPYTPYEDPRIAAMSGAETTALHRAQTMGQDYQGDLTRARELTEQGAGSFVDADIQGYMNPYIEGALDPAARELREQIAREQEEIGGAAGMVGAFGGGRQAILESESRRGGQEAIGDLYGRGYAGAFESARDQFNQDRDAFARGAEQFRATGAQGQAQLTQDIQNLLTTGGLQRTLEQAGLDFDYQQFTEARDWDITNLEPLLKTLSTVPHGETQTTTQKKSTFDAIMGVASLAASTFFGKPSTPAEGAAPQPLGGTGAGGGYWDPGYGQDGGSFGGPSTLPAWSPNFGGGSTYERAYG